MTRSIQIRIPQVDVDRFKRDVDAYGKHARFAFARSLNATALDIQAATRAEIDPNLTVRTPGSRNFLQQRVMIPRGGYARKDNLRVQIGVMDGDALKNRGKASLMAALSSGGDVKVATKVPFAVPTRVLRDNPRAVIPAAFYPRALRVLESNYTGAGRNTVPNRTRGRSKKRGKYGLFGSAPGHLVVKGKSRTFALDPRFHPGLTPNAYGVYQRIGPKKRDIQLLWHYQMRVPVPDRIPFQDVADRVTVTNWAGHYTRELDRALSTAL